jgi:hypothetical protein
MVLLACFVVCECGVVGAVVWPLAAAKWRASPDRLRTDLVATQPGVPATRPANWAQPLSAPGLANFFRVSPDLYRGQRAAAEGFRQLNAMGVKTDVNLEVFFSDKQILAGTGLNYVPISFKAWHPEMDDMAAFLKVVTDANLCPVFVHCQHGSDRTGTMCAVYRIAVQGWSKQEAIGEMVHGGYGFHTEWQNLLEFVDHLDVPELKKKAGIDR